MILLLFPSLPISRDHDRKHDIMSGIKENFVIPFTGALQASLAVLLTIFYGVIAAQFNLLNEKSAKDISKACVRLFLPALLIVNVGQQLSLESVSVKEVREEETR